MTASTRVSVKLWRSGGDWKQDWKHAPSLTEPVAAVAISTASKPACAADAPGIGHEVGIDDAALVRVSGYWSRLAKARGLAVGVPPDFDARFLKHQIAGGVMTTIVRQLK
jgi:hypothetical protein